MNLPIIARKLITFVAILAFVTLLVAAVVVPVASYDPSIPSLDVPNGYAFFGSIPKGLHLDVQHYWTALFTLVCLVGCGFMVRE